MVKFFPAVYHDILEFSARVLVQWQKILGGGVFAETELIVDTPISAVNVMDFNDDGDIDVVSERELGAAVNEVTSRLPAERYPTPFFQLRRGRVKEKNKK